MSKTFRDYLKHYLAELPREIEGLALEQLALFYDYLESENRHYNLTAIEEPEQVVIRHFVDSLALQQVPAFQQAKTILDVGSGAGFPGIPLAICNPNKKFVLLDSLQKRVRFLENTAQKLGLTNVGVVNERAESFGQLAHYRELFDLVTARAVANLAILGEYCLPSTRVGGCFIAMKSDSGMAELESAATALTILGGGQGDVIAYQLPDGRQRQLIIIPKIMATPTKYPRRPGMPKKRPLK